MNFYGFCSFRPVQVIPEPAPEPAHELVRHQRISYYLTACDVPNIIRFDNENTIATPFDDGKCVIKNVTKDESIEYARSTTKLTKSFSHQKLITDALV